MIKPTLTLKALLAKSGKTSPFDEFILEQLIAKKPENIQKYTWTQTLKGEESEKVEKLIKIRFTKLSNMNINILTKYKNYKLIFILNNYF